MLRLAWYGDDFTGASDTLATLASAGRRALLFTGVPTLDRLERAGPLDALGIAGTARALSPEAMQAELGPVARFFSTLGASVTHYKCCSTFDSAIGTGNLAVGLRALRWAHHAPWAAIIGGQPSLGRYCAFGELYATASAGGPVYRIDRHPTMSRHPVTPMDEADLRRHLARQGLSRTAAIDLRDLDGLDDAALADALEQRLAQDPEAVLFDAARPGDLARIGRLLWQQVERQPLLALGASSVAQALLAQWPGQGRTIDAPVRVEAAQGPVFLMVGSLSPVTAAQVAEAGDAYDTRTIDAATLVGSDAALERWAADCAARLRAGAAVLSLAVSADVGASVPPLAVASACGRLLARVLALAPEVRRVGVAGGDTSSLALRVLDPWGFKWCGSLAPGVPLLRVQSDDPALQDLELMLKGGQMGPPDVFLRLLRGSPLA